MTVSKINISELQLVKHKCDNSMLFFTRYFFAKSNKRKFVVGDHHKLISDALDKVLSGETKKLIINIAPRYGKTELAVKNFIAKGLALNPSSRFIHLSYSDDLALDNSDSVREIVKSEEFQEMYPDVKIKQNSDSKKKWYTEQNGGVYATAAAGQVTGFGAGQVDEEVEEEDFDFIEQEGVVQVENKFGGALIIDDPIKPDDADSETKRERINQRYDSTLKNRVNSRNTPIIIIMQRLHENDLCGHLTSKPGHGWTVLSLPCLKKDGTALWDFKHTVEELKVLKGENLVVFERQYQQDPQPKKGLLYKEFKTYQSLPSVRIIKNYTDTADTGSDYLCSISYVEPLDTEDKNIYVIDVLYTDEPMEITEPLVIDTINLNRVNLAYVESNNGGRGFSRVIEKGVNAEIESFHQSNNKEARIYSRSAQVNNRIIFPSDWQSRWPLFFDHIRKFKTVFKSNKQDDGPDTLTGIIEMQDQDDRGVIGW